ncbi:MAG: hypothetical protein H6737_02725 [Alphaproteobacteria bacterium]|nr:hypothetical protein [Alphaproteobacteria bacterium]
MLAILAALLCPSALAQSHVQFDWGMALYEQGDFESALMEWEALYENTGSAVVMRHVANAYVRLGDAKGERQALEIYYTVAPAPVLKELRERIESLGGAVPMRDLREVQKARHEVGSDLVDPWS